MISICINTRNRPQDLERCLKSILDSDYKSYEIVVVDQSDAPQGLPKSLLKKSIKYIIDQRTGVGKAKNLAIENTHGDILAFTDDDCIVDKNWLKNIQKIFDANPKVSGMFGRVVPYKPSLHKSLECPCTVNRKVKNLVTKPEPHWKVLGFGNNMAFRKKAVIDSGNFKSWLGPGSIGSNAEDAEIALRLLCYGHSLLYTPLPLVKHNKWVAKSYMHKQNLSYTCGEMACYGYFYFQGYAFAKSIVAGNIKNSISKLRRLAKSVLFFKWNQTLLTDIKLTMTEVIYRIRGLCVAWYYSIFDPLTVNS